MIGVISDTHGLMRPEALAALAGSELIIHGGDVGDAAVLDALRTVAPVVAIRGNVDTQAWAAGLPEREMVERDGASIYILHDVNQIDIDPVVAGLRVVVSGHSHKPSIRSERGVLYFNPGSAGPRRFKLPVTVGRLIGSGEGLRGEIVRLFPD